MANRRPPFHNMKKSELIWMARNHCKAHRHTYLEHYSCYVAEKPQRPERIGYLDIEASALVADWGQMLSWCILDSVTGKIHFDVLTKDDLEKYHNGDEDRRIVKSVIDKMGEMDRIVTYYGARYDIPMIRARAHITGVRFPYPHGLIKHKDCYDIIKSKFKLSSRRQENACRQILGQTEKTRVDSRYWRAAVRGDSKALNYVLEHNKADVRDLQRLYETVKDYVKVNNTSI